MKQASLASVLCMILSINHSIAQNITYSGGANNSQISQEQLRLEAEADHIETIDNGHEFSIYPQRSNLTPKQFQTYSLDMNPISIELEQPICIVGADQFSQSWIAKHVENLENSQTICFVTNVTTDREVQLLRNISQKTMFLPADIGWVEMLGIKHYPALITNEVVFQ